MCNGTPPEQFMSPVHLTDRDALPHAGRSANRPAHLSRLLDDGLAQLAITLDVTQRVALLDYVALLDKWNKAYNLTAIREPARMVPLHILDSLSVLKHLGPLHAGARLTDVGAGAGLPGIPLAIARPDLEVTLIDTVQKKTTFMQHAIGTLGLHHASAQHVRVEAYRAHRAFDVVISRAFAELKDFVDAASHLCGCTGRLYAMKGVHPHDEIARLDGRATVEAVLPLVVPGVDAQRHLVILKPTSTTK
jgi:16S rRNA (guanine527-N7)-methyltransferase